MPLDNKAGILALKVLLENTRVEIEIKENRLHNHHEEDHIFYILGFVKSYLLQIAIDIPVKGKIHVYIYSTTNVQFIFENISKKLENQFRMALNYFFNL